jgi:hypothetical protein
MPLIRPDLYPRGFPRLENKSSSSACRPPHHKLARHTTPTFGKRCQMWPLRLILPRTNFPSPFVQPPRTTRCPKAKRDSQNTKQKELVLHNAFAPRPLAFQYLDCSWKYFFAGKNPVSIRRMRKCFLGPRGVQALSRFRRQKGLKTELFWSQNLIKKNYLILENFAILDTFEKFAILARFITGTSRARNLKSGILVACRGSTQKNR